MEKGLAGDCILEAFELRPVGGIAELGQGEFGAKVGFGSGSRSGIVLSSQEEYHKGNDEGDDEPMD